MKIHELKAFKGRNIYSHRKVIKLVIDLGKWSDTPTKNINNFNDNLLRLLPGLKRTSLFCWYTGRIC